MKGKLIKEEEGYYVYVNTETIGTTRPLLNFDLVKYKLSLKNCQAIERGYDLDELADEHYDIHIKRGHTEEDSLQRKIDFILGFQRALELMGDKKFSEYDMTSIFEYGWNQRHYEIMDEAELEGIKNRYIQSLQQTEWDVIIEMVPAMSNNGNVYYGDIPKLDADGCLILKKL